MSMGYASRNEYLGLPYHKILRLGAIICLLRESGWEIDTHDDGKDCVYKLVKCPYQIRTITLSNGETIKQLCK